MKHLMNIIFVLVAVFLINVGSAHAAYNLQEYYPLTEGNSRTYFYAGTETEGGNTDTWSGTDTETISCTENVNGVSTIKLLGDWESDQEYWSDNLAWDAEGLKLYRCYEVDSPSDGETESQIEEELFVTPLLIFPAQMEIGQTVSHDFAVELYENGELAGYEEGTVSLTLEGVETITVEAGTFEECLKIHEEFTCTQYDRQGGTAEESDSEDNYVWLAPGIGTIKMTRTETDYDSTGNVVGTETEIEELRWATINGSTIGAGLQLWNGFDFSLAEAHFEGSTMRLRNVLSGDLHYNDLAFRLDLDNIFYAFEPGGYNPVSIPGLDFSAAYIKMTSGTLHIYNIDIGGVKYWTQWNLETSPIVGFSFIDFGLM